VLDLLALATRHVGKHGEQIAPNGGIKKAAEDCSLAAV
jgi:hypothetical protein